MLHSINFPVEHGMKRTTQYEGVEEILRLINDPDFQSKHKKAVKDFIRNRKFGFVTVVGMLLRMIKNSLQIDCNFLGDLMKIEAGTKQAFSQARAKIDAEAFQEMHESTIRTHYTTAPAEGLWRGYRLIACDGSTGRLPRSNELEAEYGLYPGKEEGVKYPVMARISEFTDMTNKLVLSGCICSYATSEEKLAEKQLGEVTAKMRRLGQKNLLYVYDRGYPGERFIDQHILLGVDFLFRLPKDFNKATTEICSWADSEGFIAREGWPLLRLVKIPLTSGEVELLLTTLTDKIYKAEDLSEVYQGRWISMEEGYKKQKITMQLENFSGKTATAVKQEYWATLVVANLLEMGCIGIEGCWVPGNLPEKHVNRSVLFGSMRDATIGVIFGLISPEEYDRKFKKMAERFMLKVRPNRNYSREGVGQPKRHHVYRRSC